MHDRIGGDHVPSRAEIADWLAGRAPEDHRRSWAGALHGLPWRFIRPLVTVAETTGVHPVGVMGVAARFSDDPVLIDAVRAQLERLEEGP